MPDQPENTQIPTPPNLNSQDVPPPPVPARSIPVVTEEVVYAPQAQPAPPTPVAPVGARKFLLIALVLIILGGAGFAIKQFFFATPSVEGVTLAYWGFEEEATINGLIKEYEAKNPNVKINYAKQAKADYRERLVNNLAKNAGPDLFHFHNTWVPMIFSHLAPAPPEVFSQASFASAFYPVAVKDLASSAPLGIPLEIDGLGLYINETIFSNSQKLVPTNWNDLRNTAFELTIVDAEGRIQQSGIALGRLENVDHWQEILSLMLLQNKADLENPAGSLAGDPMLYFASFSEDFKTWDETLPASTEAFAKGQVAMYLAPVWRVREIKQLNPNLAFRVVTVPQLPKNTPDDPDINLASYWAEGAWAKGKNAGEAWKFLQFLSQKSSLEKLYAAQVKNRGYGSPYARIDMAKGLENDPIIGAYLRLAPQSRSSYLVSETHDGSTGINSKISAIWGLAQDAIIKQNDTPEEVLPAVAAGVRLVLDSYSNAQ